jgi:hypothetical protein
VCITGCYPAWLQGIPEASGLPSSDELLSRTRRRSEEGLFGSGLGADNVMHLGAGECSPRSDAQDPDL